MSVNNNKLITKAARYNAKEINYDRIVTSYRNIHICGILSIDKRMTNYTMSYRHHLLLSKGNYVNVMFTLANTVKRRSPMRTFWHAPYLLARADLSARPLLQAAATPVSTQEKPCTSSALAPSLVTRRVEESF